MRMLKCKKFGMATPTSDKVVFKTKGTSKEKERHLKIIKR